LSDTTDPKPGEDGKDYTVDAETVKPGAVIFRYGYLPCVVFSTQDGKIEVGHFREFTWEDPNEFSTARVPLPAAAGPAEPTRADRVADLEDQVASLTRILAKLAPDDTATPPPAPDPEPTPVTSPFANAEARSTT
jgi:hypothetical protein